MTKKEAKLVLEAATKGIDVLAITLIDLVKEEKELVEEFAPNRIDRQKGSK